MTIDEDWNEDLVSALFVTGIAAIRDWVIYADERSDDGVRLSELMPDRLTSSTYVPVPHLGILSL